jgi:hypothetical protein
MTKHDGDEHSPDQKEHDAHPGPIEASPGHADEEPADQERGRGVQREQVVVDLAARQDERNQHEADPAHEKASRATALVVAAVAAQQSPEREGQKRGPGQAFGGVGG